MFLKNVYSLFLFIFALNLQISAQNTFLNKDVNYYYESALNFDSSFHYSIKPYKQDYYKNVIIQKVNTGISILNNIFNDNLINSGNEKFNFCINPIINSVIYNDFSRKEFFEDYKAGIRFQSSYKNTLFISSEFFTAQSQFPSFYNNLIDDSEIVPYYGKYLRNHNFDLLYYSWTGDLTYQANKNISFSVGRGKNFLGNGYRSLFLSDNSNAYPYLKTEIDIWKIKYLWMVAKLSDIRISEGANPLILYDKAAFTHYFSLNITKRINFDFFETVITNPFDIEGRRISYDAVYFNPVIFYRPTEFYKGSSDNSIMGLGLNIRFGKSSFLYSQFILDDLVISSLKDGSGWWGNKFGIQAGVKIYNLLKVQGLFIRGEMNFVRPYTYSHGEAYISSGIANLNYGNFRRESAHPFGANFAEGIAVVRYVKGRFSGKLRINLIKKGEDTDTISYGGDIYKSYNLRPSNYGISFLQGTLTDYQIIDIGVSYLLNPKYNLMFQAGFYYRKRTNKFITDKNQIIYIGFSGNIFNSLFD